MKADSLDVRQRVREAALGGSHTIAKFCVACILLLAPIQVSVARQKGWLAAVPRSRPEISRDVKLEAALIKALYEGDRKAAARDKVRYLYNRVDLNGDGRPETLVYLSALAWCGSAGCVACVFQTVEGRYELVTHISGVEAPVIVSRKRTNEWNELIGYVRWGEVEGHTLRDYYAVLRYDGRTYPDQFPGSPPLGAGDHVTGIAYFSNVNADQRGIPLTPGQGSRVDDALRGGWRKAALHRLIDELLSLIPREYDFSDSSNDHPIDYCCLVKIYRKRSGDSA
jgi:hypothetical protein